jgi:hypothetical protein
MPKGFRMTKPPMPFAAGLTGNMRSRWSWMILALTRQCSVNFALGYCWVGYKAHLTETCDEDKPRLITQVETTLATIPDHEVIDQLHEHLEAKDLLPSQHLVDAGYINSDLLVRHPKICLFI